LTIQGDVSVAVTIDFDLWIEPDARDAETTLALLQDLHPEWAGHRNEPCTIASSSPVPFQWDNAEFQ
jgi:hypothetical protein